MLIKYFKMIIVVQKKEKKCDICLRNKEKDKAISYHSCFIAYIFKYVIKFNRYFK